MDQGQSRTFSKLATDESRQIPTTSLSQWVYVSTTANHTGELHSGLFVKHAAPLRKFMGKSISLWGLELCITTENIKGCILVVLQWRKGPYSFCKMPQESYFPFTSLWDLAWDFLPDLCMLLKCMQFMLVASNLYFMAEVCTQTRKAQTCYT